jgi:hypothetical protein
MLLAPDHANSIVSVGRPLLESLTSHCSALWMSAAPTAFFGWPNELIFAQTQFLSPFGHDSGKFRRNCQPASIVGPDETSAPG